MSAIPARERNRQPMVDHAQMEDAMQEKLPSNQAQRKEGGVIDQRQQQIDPAGKHRDDPNEAKRRSQKQPGQDLRETGKANGDAE